MSNTPSFLFFPIFRRLSPPKNIFFISFFTPHITDSSLLSMLVRRPLCAGRQPPWELIGGASSSFFFLHFYVSRRFSFAELTANDGMGDRH